MNGHGSVHARAYANGYGYCKQRKNSSACASQADERSGATYAASPLFCDCLFVLICAEQERDDLRSGAGGVRVKSAAAYAGRDAVFHRPCNCLCIVSVRRNIHKRAHALGFRRTCRAPQEGDRLRSGARCIRAEQVVSGTAGNAVFHCPGNRFA